MELIRDVSSRAAGAVAARTGRTGSGSWCGRRQRAALGDVVPAGRARLPASAGAAGRLYADDPERAPGAAAGRRQRGLPRRAPRRGAGRSSSRACGCGGSSGQPGRHVGVDPARRPGASCSPRAPAARAPRGRRCTWPRGRGRPRSSPCRSTSGTAVLIPTAYYTGETFGPAGAGRSTRCCTSTGGDGAKIDGRIGRSLGSQDRGRRSREPDRRAREGSPRGRRERRTRDVSLLFVVWIIVGIVIAVQRGYLTASRVRAILSALLACPVAPGPARDQPARLTGGHVRARMPTDSGDSWQRLESTNDADVVGPAGVAIGDVRDRDRRRAMTPSRRGARCRRFRRAGRGSHARLSP